jgi:hypothetical protein
MVRNLVGYEVLTRDLRWLDPVLKSWIKVNRAYANVWRGKDALYWYNERPNVGALAAAAWKSGMYAVEEYAAIKHHPITKKSSGRIDLYVTAANGKAATIEAKQCWVFPKTTKRTLANWMKAALNAARLDDEEDAQKIGVVFYTMKVPIGEISEKVLKNEVERIRQIKVGALAWCFPKINRRLESEMPEHEGFVWPGVVMALNSA